MSRLPGKRAAVVALLAVLALALAACSATGGKRAAEADSNIVAGHAPSMVEDHHEPGKCAAPFAQ
jgi:outer membrane biogenesis lipoprotein LolB